MSENIPAFPRPLSRDVDGRADFAQDGMTLRDYFAAQAMQGIMGMIANDVTLRTASGPITEADISMQAYEFADAMLKARD